MTRTVVLDEVRLVIRVPPRLPPRRVSLVRRTILGKQFARRVRAAARDALATAAAVSEVAVRVTVAAAG